MQRLLSVLGVLLALVFIAASAAMNWAFLSAQGKTELEGHILGAVSVAADGLKALLPLFLVWAWRAKRFAFVAVGGVALALFLSFSFLSAIGFAAMNRGAVTDGRETLTARLEAVELDLKSLDEKLASRQTLRSSAVIEAELDRLKQDRRFASSDRCTNATAISSRAFCDGFHALRAELAASVAASRQESQRAELKAEALRLKSMGAGVEADPQAGLLAKFSGFDVARMQLALVVLIAVLVEMGAAFGLYLATGFGFEKKRPAAPEASAPMRDVTPQPLRPARKPRRNNSRAVVPATQSDVKLMRLELGADGSLHVSD